MKLTFDTSDFERATRALEKTVRRNTEAYGRTLAREFESGAKSGAPWTDRRGNARMKLYGKSSAGGSTVRVEMGGEAPNYKRHGPLSAADYMEYLEFAHEKRYAIVFPMAEAIAEDMQKNFGEAALKGKPRISVKRNRKDLDKARKAILTQTRAGWFLLAEQMRYAQWQADHAAFNHR